MVGVDPSLSITVFYMRAVLVVRQCPDGIGVAVPNTYSRVAPVRLVRRLLLGDAHGLYVHKHGGDLMK
jgi:hypothetical protein